MNSIISTPHIFNRFLSYLVFFMTLVSGGRVLSARGLESKDLPRLRSVGEVQFSPDGRYIAYTVENNNAHGRPYSQLWILNMADGKTTKLSEGVEPTADPQWSPDSQWIAFVRGESERSFLAVSHPDGSGLKKMAPILGTNSPLPYTGSRISWSPDNTKIAFVHAVPGPETELANGDPMVVTRYLYKPDYNEGLTRFNDNRRVHIFLAELNGGQVVQLTTGDYYEHSLDWSPDGEEILFVSNREPNADQFHNYDVFSLRIADRTIRRLTATESAEYQPRWSPDGKKIAFLATRRGLTDLETTMEDTHVWVMDRNGSQRHELGSRLDNRQESPGWSIDGKAVFCTLAVRGNVGLYRLPIAGGEPEPVVTSPGKVTSWSAGAGNRIAYSFSSTSDTSQLYIKPDGNQTRRLTNLNELALSGLSIAEVESFTFVSNDNRYEIEAFLTKPLGMRATSKHPLIVNIHGGPHGQQGPAFHFKNQVYANKGWATLMVNYRGSTGYGQEFADAVFGDQNGNEGQDVLYGVSAALRRYLWLDRERLGIEGVSYGGQLTAWLVTQTTMFKAAIPIAGITNLVSYNYMTYYNQYEQMEFGIFPHQGDLMDELWKRSALRHAAKVKTPVMLMHGENDSDVPIAESEQFFIALKDVGVETVMVRYPREGHGLREPGHIVDSIDRAIVWYEMHFPPFPAGLPGRE